MIGTVVWRDLNRRRFTLIQKQVRGRATARERYELAKLQALVSEEINRRFPPPPLLDLSPLMRRLKRGSG